MPENASLGDLTQRMVLDETHNFNYGGVEYQTELWTIINGPIMRWVHFYRIENGLKTRIGMGMQASNGTNPIDVAIALFLRELA